MLLKLNVIVYRISVLMETHNNQKVNGFMNKKRSSEFLLKLVIKSLQKHK